MITIRVVRSRVLRAIAKQVTDIVEKAHPLSLEFIKVIIPFFLGLTILIQLAGGAAMVVGYQTKIVAFVLAGLTLVISLLMHDFWTLPAGELQTAHETQNFVKNMAIMAGLLVAAGMGGGEWSLDSRRGY